MEEADRTEEYGADGPELGGQLARSEGRRPVHPAPGRQAAAETSEPHLDQGVAE